MATPNKTLPTYYVTAYSRCKFCNAEIVWQQSYKVGAKKYPTDVQLDTLQNRITSRNWFHTCKSQQSVEPVQPTLFEKTFNVKGIMDLFDKAQAHLKWPKIRFATTTGQVVELRRAGARSHNPGHLQVTDGEKFGFNKYFGRIDLQGNWHPGRDCTPEVVSLLNQLSEDPAGTAAAYGKLTGNCCFCNQSLFGEDGKSVAVGYGPVCADHYGLPWG